MKKKKDSLMATYRQLLNKVKASNGTGSGAKDVIKPNWFAYNAMAFLHGIYAAKKTISTEVSLISCILFNYILLFGYNTILSCIYVGSIQKIIIIFN